MSDNRASDNPVVRQLQLLTTGWGYNFYNDANKARADDLLVREKAARYLGDATAALSALEVAYRRQFIPAATREQPFPPADVLERLRAIGRLKARVSGVSDHLRGASAPTQDKVWFRLRSEQTLLYQLLAIDHSTIDGTRGIADLARALTPETWDAGPDAATTPITDALAELDDALRRRRELLLVPTF